jgi:hypothetical protein
VVQKQETAEWPDDGDGGDGAAPLSHGCAIPKTDHAAGEPRWHGVRCGRVPRGQTPGASFADSLFLRGEGEGRRMGRVGSGILQDGCHRILFFLISFTVRPEVSLLILDSQFVC